MVCWPRNFGPGGLGPRIGRGKTSFPNNRNCSHFEQFAILEEAVKAEGEAINAG